MEELSYNNLKELFKDYKISPNEQPPTEVLRSIRDKLFTMFCSPMKEEYTYEAFKWVSNLCLSIGDKFWTLDKANWSTEDAKVISCIARLSMGEVQILLPLIRRHLNCGDEPDVEDGKLLERSANSNDYDRFGNHLIILESVIKCLVEGQDFDYGEDCDEKKPTDNSNCQLVLTDHLRGEELINLLDRFKEIMKLICDYLEDVNKSWDNLMMNKNDHQDKLSSAEAALRFISVWLSEEPDAFVNECESFLIELLVKNLLLIDRPSKDDLLILALHSICTQNKNLMKTLKKIPKHEQALESYLDFVQRENSKSSSSNDDKRNKKLFKLRCGLIKDLLSS